MKDRRYRRLIRLLKLLCWLLRWLLLFASLALAPTGDTPVAHRAPPLPTEPMGPQSDGQTRDRVEENGLEG
jgi:hypothetical protein